MSRKILPLIAVSVAMVCGVASAQQSGQSAHFRREAHISIAADGEVTALHFIDGKASDDQIAKRLEPLIRSWTFAPGRIDGKPMPTETTLSLDLEMQRTAGATYSIKLLGAFTGVGVLSTPAPPYPRQAMQARIEAQVVLLMTIDGSGAPTDIKVSNVMGSGPGASRASFTTAAIDAAKHWKFQPETVGGHSMAGTVVRVPISFCMDKASQCPTLARQIAAQGKPLPPNHPVDLHSQARLVTHVVGTTF